MLKPRPIHPLIIALPSTSRSELSSIKSNTEVVVQGLGKVQGILPAVERRVSELSGKLDLVTTSQTATQGFQNIQEILNRVVSSHETTLQQLGQKQSNEFSEVKQLIQDLSLKIDAHASTGSKVATTYSSSYTRTLAY